MLPKGTKSDARRQERFAPLKSWLERARAVPLWQQDVKSDTVKPHCITAYLIGGHVVLLQTLGDGWQLYLPASKENGIAADLDAAAEFCGVDGCAGLVPGE